MRRKSAKSASQLDFRPDCNGGATLCANTLGRSTDGSPHRLLDRPAWTNRRLHTILGRACILAVTVTLAVGTEIRGEDAEEVPVADTLPARVPWTESRVIGSPEPPPPYTIERVFSKIEWKSPVWVLREPNSNFLIVVEWPQDDAPGRAVRLLDQAGVKETQPFLEIENGQFYDLEFHPNYSENGQIFVCYKVRTGEQQNNNILARFTVAGGDQSSDVLPIVDLDSEQELVRWYSEGHDGAALAFGHDGMLYVTVGDGTADSDDSLSAQDASNLLGSVLRLDVDDPPPGEPYAIPPDNPFVDQEGVRGEIWSIGHRNPWRIDVDERTGHIWVGNNGQDLWEFAHLLRAGDNCGWSVYEGSHPFYLNRQRGPGRFAPPTVEHDHSEFRSLTGGVVYYGKVLPQLEGAYIYGDYATGAIWGVYHDGQQTVWNRELARTTLDIVGFGVSHREEMLVVGHASGLYRLVESPPDDSHLRFPRRLSETGLFASTVDLAPAPGVYPYSVRAPGWADGATAERFIAIPADGTVERPNATAPGTFPEGTVLAQTLFLPQTKQTVSPAQRIETRLLTLQGGVWAAYSYVWNDAQDDALLVEAAGTDIDLPADAGASHRASGGSGAWHVPSRNDCMSCHSRAAGFVLGFAELQLDREAKYDEAVVNQVDALVHWKLLNDLGPSTDEEQAPPKLIDPYDESADLEARARGYLHVNCAPCHVAAGGGNARMELSLATARDKMQLIDVYPQHQSFGLQQPQLVAAGAPDRSVLRYRISRRGPGQMPPRGTHAVDSAAVELFDRWIAELTPRRKFVKHWTLNDLTSETTAVRRGRSFEAGKQAFNELGCAQCHRFDNAGGGAGPNLSQLVGKRQYHELLESIIEPSSKIEPEFATTLVQTVEGRTLRGRIQQENASQLVLALNTTDALGEPLVVPKKDIENRGLSSISTMPARLLDTLEKSQILDLLAYLMANADPNNPAFNE